MREDVAKEKEVEVKSHDKKMDLGGMIVMS